MKAQTRKGAMIESAANLAVGFWLSWAINYFALPLFGMKPSTGSLYGLGAIFTVASVVRSYCLRRVFERHRVRQIPPAFLHIVEDLARERHRQISGEGYDLAHDDSHKHGELASAAAAYCLAGANAMDGIAAATLKAEAFPGTRVDSIRRAWPWDLNGFKPVSRRRCLEKAGALIIAELGRQEREEQRRGGRT